MEKSIPILCSCWYLYPPLPHWKTWTFCPCETVSQSHFDVQNVQNKFGKSIGGKQCDVMTSTPNTDCRSNGNRSNRNKPISNEFQFLNYRQRNAEKAMWMWMDRQTHLNISTVNEPFQSLHTAYTLLHHPLSAQSGHRHIQSAA